MLALCLLSCTSQYNVGTKQTKSSSNQASNEDTAKNSICSSQHNPTANIGEIIEIGPPLTGPFPYFEFLEGPVWLDNIDGESLFCSPFTYTLIIRANSLNIFFIII